MKKSHSLLFFITHLLAIRQPNVYKIISQQLEQAAGLRKGQMGSDILRQIAIVIKLAQGYPMDAVKLMAGLKSMITLKHHLNLVNIYLEK